MKYLLLLLCLLFVFSYQSVPPKNPQKTLCPEWDAASQVALLGQELEVLHRPECYQTTDTLLESDENEGVTWKAKIVGSKDSTLFWAESNWENTHQVSRITLFSPYLEPGGIRVGMKVAEIRSLLSKTVPVSPDGWLFVRHATIPQLDIALDLSHLPEGSPLLEGAFDLDQIPDSLRVTSMVLMNR